MAKSHLTLCDPMGYGPPAPKSMGILQARTLEWAAISFSRELPDPGTEATSPGPPALIGRLLTMSHLGALSKPSR